MDHPPFRVLVFSRTAAYRHASIPAGIRALERLAAASAASADTFTVRATEDPAVFAPASLAAYRVIVLLQCSGEFLTDPPSQLAALRDFVHGGGGIVAVHCASFALASSPWYARLIGAAFENHPDPQRGRVRIVDPRHPIIAASLGNGSGMRQLSAADAAADADAGESERGWEWEWDWLDEWYNFKMHPREANPDLHVLLTVDEASYAGGAHGEDHPVAWCHEFDGGRCFYTALGHFDEAYEDDGFMAQLLGGILWAARVTG